MMRYKLVQVLARLNPGACGVSDHALALAESLIREHNIETVFAVINSRNYGDVRFPVVVCSPGDLAGVCAQYAEFGPCSVLVHVSGYGYSADGVPWKLANAMLNMSKYEGIKIASYFHELFYAGCEVWKRAFWAAHRQKAEIIKIAEHSDAIYTNTAEHANWLQRNLRNRDNSNVRVMPVFSTVGEPLYVRGSKEKNRSMIVFGLEASRRMSYRYLRANEAKLSRAGIHKIIDIGPGLTKNIFKRIAVEKRGPLSSEDLSEILLKSMYGFVPHRPQSAAKSSILAAYCAHGVTPVIPCSFKGEIDGLRDGDQVVSLSRISNISRSSTWPISYFAQEWYGNHSINVHAKAYAEWVNNNNNLCSSLRYCMHSA